MERIHLAQNMDQLWALLDAVLNLRIQHNSGNFLIR
jgi:hypothetical protein